MADPTNIQLNKVSSNPQLKDLLDLMKKDILLNFNCHAIATVQSFNASHLTVQATVNYKKTFFRQDPKTKMYNPVLEDYAILIDCPVIILGGGATTLTFPIAKGDQCVVLFNDRDLDNWFQGNTGGAVATSRLHSFSDGMVLIGPRSLAQPIAGYDTARAVLKDNAGGAMVGVHAALVKIANNGTTLNTLLQDLITQIKALVTATAAITVTGVTPGGGTSGPPSNATAINNVGTQLTTVANNIAGLLE